MPNGKTQRQIGWISGFRTQADMAREVGVSQSAMSRYITGVAPIPRARAATIERYYERQQYATARASGASVKAASSIRGLSVVGTEAHLENIKGCVDLFTEGRLGMRAYVSGLDIEDMPLDEWWGEEEALTRASTALSDMGLADYELRESP